MKYTVDLVFWNPDTCSVCVEAKSVEEAIKLAFAVAWEGGTADDGSYETMRHQETCMDACTDTAIAGIARGRHDTAYDAPAGAQLKVPIEHQDILWEPQGIDDIEWRRNKIKRLEAEIAELRAKSAAKEPS